MYINIEGLQEVYMFYALQVYPVHGHQNAKQDKTQAQAEPKLPNKFLRTALKHHISLNLILVFRITTVNI